MMRWRSIGSVRLALASAWVCAGIGCADTPQSRVDADAPVLVCAGIPPIAGFVERVGGAHVRVQSLLAAGQSPHAFEPTPKLVADVCSARLLIEIGLPFEHRIIEKVRHTATGLQIVDAGAGIALRPLAAHEAHAGHDHAECNHDAGELDPHVWMSPRNSMAHVRRICDALTALDPEHRADFETNRDALLREIDELDGEVGELLAPFHGRSFYVFHPAYGYFAQAYGLKQVAIQSRGQQPAARELQALVMRARADRITVLLVQPQFDKRNARTIAEEIGATVVTADPLAWDYVAGIRALAESIRRGMGPADASIGNATSMASSNGVDEAR